MSDTHLVFSEHALDRLLEWAVTEEEVEEVLRTGDTIEQYDDGALLVFGRAGVRPLHLVVAEDISANSVVVVTLYEPDEKRWDATLRIRRK